MRRLWRINLKQLSQTATLIITLLLTNNTSADPLFEFKKVGQAKLKVLFWDIYDSSLYTSNGQYQADIFPQALELVYLRDIEADDLIKSTKEEWQKLGIEEQNSARWLVSLAGILPDIKEGDKLTLVVSDTKQSEFFYNADSIGVMADPAFGPDFLRIWLDEKSSHPKLRNKLIGNNK